MTRPVVFCGPTLAKPEVQEILPNALIAPPVVQGDVIRAVGAGATFIGIIDGLFESTPSVTHKEILWALSKGIPVYGAASMGALRAAELHPFGMIGIGLIFQDFRDGVNVDDDEVAVSHAPAYFGSEPISAAMVDIRAHLHVLCEQQVINLGTLREMIAHQKALHFTERGYASLTAAFPRYQNHFPTEPRAHSRKADDARAMLKAMRKPAALKKPTDWVFEETAFWRDLYEHVISEDQPWPPKSNA